MGSIKKAIDDAAGKQDADRVKERLQLLLLAAEAKIQGFRDQINEGFLNPGMIDKIEIPGIRAIRFIEQYHVAASSSFSQQVTDHLTSAIDAFFSIGGKDVDTRSAIQNGLKSIIMTALDGFLGSTDAGESQEKFYMVVPENNAFVRVDVATWKYHLEDKGFAVNQDTAVAYVLCKSVVDHTKVTLDELIYLASSALSQTPFTRVEKTVYMRADGKENTMLEKIPVDGIILTDANREAYNGADAAVKAKYYIQLVKSFRADAKGNITLKDRTKGNEPDNWVEWLQGGSIPPSIDDVEAYISELVRVWNKLKSSLNK